MSTFTKTVKAILIGLRGAFSAYALVIWLFILRNERKVTGLQLAALRLRNLYSRTLVTAPNGPIVSVTSYGARLRTVHLALESIAAGSVLPSRLILWVDTLEALNEQSDGLKRLVKRGLEIYLTANLGPHKKYYPYLMTTKTPDLPLVTADDDMLYSKWWLKYLVRSVAEYPDAVSCYRAQQIAFVDGELVPYSSWKNCRSSEPMFRHFATGVSGCIYPPAMLEGLRREGDSFLKCCPHNDDVWLHANAIRVGFKIRQVWPRALRFPFIPGTQATGLYHSNVFLGRTDREIVSTYTSKDLAFLKESIDSHGGL